MIQGKYMFQINIKQQVDSYYGYFKRTLQVQLHLQIAEDPQHQIFLGNSEPIRCSWIVYQCCI